eukprot:SAG31_NODE_344_length_17385_cov_58.217575_16_plen_416_part_00
MPVTVTPMPHLPFGCTVSGISLAEPQLPSKDFQALARAFHAYGVVILRGQHNLHPRQEVALCRRLERLWCDKPAKMPERTPTPTNLRGCHPPGFPEVAILGNGEFVDHFGLSGHVSVQGPQNWHEEASLGWHPDGAYDGREENVLTCFCCYVSPSAAPNASYGVSRWPCPEGTAQAGDEAVLQYPAGATVFASTTTAFDLCTPQEQELLRLLQVRYFEAPTAMARRLRDVYPIMDPAGIRPLHPPPGPEPECEVHFEAAGFNANGSSRNDKHGGGLPEYGRNDDAQEVYPVEPLVYKTATGRESLRCHTVGMRRLEPLGAVGDAGARTWEDSQALVSRVFGRAVLPELVLVHEWQAGDVVLTDNRTTIHSATPSDVFAATQLPSHAHGKRLIHRISLPSPLGAAPAVDLEWTARL